MKIIEAEHFLNRRGFSVIVLAGGKSSRLGRDKKNLKLWDGRTLLEVAIQKASQLSEDVILSINEVNPSIPSNVVLVKDNMSGQGPLAGIFDSLQKTHMDSALVFPVDVPFLPIKFLQYLAAQSNNYDLTLPEAGSYEQPLIGVYSKNILPKIKDLLTMENFSVKSLLYDPSIVVNRIPVRDLSVFGDPNVMFLNINTEEDLAKLEAVEPAVSWRY
jgi:molybdopterin-guanine dinucleotide biosynthesis protein A